MLNLAQFFDRVNHDMLMARVTRKVADKRLLKWIRNDEHTLNPEIVIEIAPNPLVGMIQANERTAKRLAGCFDASSHP